MKIRTATVADLLDYMYTVEGKELHNERNRKALE